MPKPPPDPEPSRLAVAAPDPQRARTRWPQPWPAVNIRYHGMFAYIGGQLADGTTLPLCRLRYNSSAHIWGFAIYQASRDGYEDNILPSGLPAGTPPEEPPRLRLRPLPQRPHRVGLQPPTNLRVRPLPGLRPSPTRRAGAG